MKTNPTTARLDNGSSLPRKAELIDQLVKENIRGKLIDQLVKEDITGLTAAVLEYDSPRRPSAEQGYPDFNRAVQDLRVLQDSANVIESVARSAALLRDQVGDNSTSLQSCALIHQGVQNVVLEWFTKPNTEKAFTPTASPVAPPPEKPKPPVPPKPSSPNVTYDSTRVALVQVDDYTCDPNNSDFITLGDRWRQMFIDQSVPARYRNRIGRAVKLAYKEEFKEDPQVLKRYTYSDGKTTQSCGYPVEWLTKKILELVPPDYVRIRGRISR